MNLSQLRFAQAVAEYQSFSRAAEHCHVTQPTLSNGIAQLEDELGGKLFERTTRSVKLTPFGRHVLSSIERALADVEEIRALADAWRNPGHKLIRIGLSPIVDMHLLLDVLAPWQERHPDVEIFFKECFIDDLDERLGTGQLDLMLLPVREERLGQQRLELYSEALLYLPRHNGALDGTEKAVSIADIAEEVLILTMDGCGLRPVTKQLFEASGHTLKLYPGQATNYNAVEDWASLGIGGGILPRSKISAGNQQTRPLLLASGEPAMVTLQLVWQANVTGSVHLDALIEYFKTQGRTLAATVAA